MVNRAKNGRMINSDTLKQMLNSSLPPLIVNVSIVDRIVKEKTQGHEVFLSAVYVAEDNSPTGY